MRVTMGWIPIPKFSLHLCTESANPTFSHVLRGFILLENYTCSEANFVKHKSSSYSLTTSSRYSLTTAKRRSDWRWFPRAVVVQPSRILHHWWSYSHLRYRFIKFERLQLLSVFLLSFSSSQIVPSHPRRPFPISGTSNGAINILVWSKRCHYVREQSWLRKEIVSGIWQ